MKFLYYHTLRVLGTETSSAYNLPRYNQNAPKWELGDGVHVTLSASYRNVKEYVSVNENNRSNRGLCEWGSQPLHLAGYTTCAGTTALEQELSGGPLTSVATHRNV